MPDRKIAIAFLLVALLRGASHAAKPEQAELVLTPSSGVQTLAGAWYCRIEDRPEFKDPGVSTEGWTPVDPARKVCGQLGDPRCSTFEGAYWYRMTFRVQDVPANDQALLLPRHYRAAQVWLNGTYLRETAPFDRSGPPPALMGPPQMVPLPPGVLRQGANTLAIRTGILSGWGGFLDPLVIGPRQPVAMRWYLQFIIPTCIACVCFFFALCYLHLYLWEKELRYHLFIGLANCSLAIWSLGYSGVLAWFTGSQLLYVIFTYAGSMALAVSSLNFFYSFHGIAKPLYARLYELSLGLVMLPAALLNYALCGNLLFFNSYFYIPLMILYGVGTLCMPAVCYAGMRKGKEYATRIMFISLIQAVAMLASLPRFLDLAPTKTWVLEGNFLMIFSLATVMIARYIGTQRDLAQAHEDLLVMDRLKDEFMAATANDLRMPLNGIHGLAQNLLSGSAGPLNAEQTRALALVSHNTSRLSKLVQSIRDFTRLRSGRVDLILEDLPLGDVIGGVVSLMRGYAGNKRILLQAEIPPLPPVRADRRRIEQVLIHLVGNAIKYTDEGSVRVSARLIEDRVEVTVADTGIGIDRERLWLLFDPLGRIDEKEAGRHKASFGLAINREIIHMHGGTITASGERGKGSAFTFTLPLVDGPRGIDRSDATGNGLVAEPEPAPAGVKAIAESTADDRGAGTRQPLLLAVDDNPVDLLILTDLCRAAGYRVVTARNGAEGLDCAVLERPDLVLLDLLMPGMSGFEFCQRLRGMAGCATIPVILLTGLSQSDDIMRGFSSGADDYVGKPYRHEELMARIGHHLRVRAIQERERSLTGALRIYRNIVAVSREQMAFIDTSRSPVAVNDAFVKAYCANGTLVSQESGLPITLPPLFTVSWEKALDETLAGREIRSEQWVTLATGERRFLTAALYPYCDETGRLHGAVFNCSDITERAEIEKTLTGRALEERQMIGMDLHDGLGHFLLNIAARASMLATEVAVSDPGLARQMREIEEQINESIRMTRRIARGVYPVNTESLELAGLLEELKSNAQKQYHVRISLSLEPDITVGGVLEKTQLYYITQEAVNNAVIHGKARAITVSLRRKNGVTRLLIEDDGSGLPETTTPGTGIGLQIMEYRARMMNADLAIDARGDCGTRVCCTLRN